MSVLIKGMEMPKNCFECPLNYDTIDCMVADIALREKGGGDFLYEHERASHCPLVPVPPHGRLIEGTAVREQIDEWLDSVGDVVVGHGLSYYGELLGCIEDAPTIITAEEGE